MRARVLFGVASAVAVVGMLWGNVTPARACSCAWPEEFTSQFFYDQADLVVLGTITEMVLNPDEYSANDRDAVFLVKRYFKGHGPEEILVDDPASSGSCGIFNDTDAGERRVLYQLREGSEYVTHSCMGAIGMSGERAEARVAAEIEAYSGPGKRPAGGSSLEHDLPYIPVVGVAVVGPLAFLAGAAFVWRG